MQVVLCNGSPRGRNSNSRVILSWLEEGLSPGTPLSCIDLAPASRMQDNMHAARQADLLVLVFPLYTDSVPGLVKAFLESLVEASGGSLEGKSLAFAVQSGFPESIHGEATAAWLERLCRRTGAVHCGTIVKGGMEGTRLMPDSMNRRNRELFRKAGEELARDGRFGAPTVRTLAGMRRFNALGRMVVRIMSVTGVMQMYWKMQLKKHGAWERRFDAPYGTPAMRP